MKQFVLILSLMAVLASCAQPSSAPATNPKEKPLFTDTDIDKAVLQVTDQVEESMGIEEGSAPEGQILAPLPDNHSNLSTQAVLPNASGFVFYVKYDAAPIIGVIPYSLYRHNQQTDTLTLIYSGNRQIQSVAGSSDGTVLLMSMRETTSPGSDYEIFLLSLSDPNNPAIIQFTNDTVDNTNVSMSRNFGRFVYEEPVSGVPTVIIMKNNGFLSFSKTILLSTLSQRHPSISGDSRYVALIRDVANGSDRVVAYDIALNSYLNVMASTAVLEHPSISNDGLKVLWLENGVTDQVMLKNLITGTTQSVASASSISHPFLTSDGKFITYQSGRTIQTKDLLNAQVQTIASSIVRLANYYAPVWQKGFESKISGITPGGSFGSSVDIEGNQMVVGVVSIGAAYIFQRNSLGAWGAIKLLAPSDAAPNSGFGGQVAISGNVVVVGAQFKDGRGAAYIFQKDQGGLNNWGQVQKIVASDGAVDDRFGSSVAISGSVVVVGAYFEDRPVGQIISAQPNVGAAYVFQRNLGGTDNWGQRKKLTASDDGANDTFGCGVAVTGTIVVVGACNESYDVNSISGDERSVGAAYIFEQHLGGNNNFGQVKKLIASDGSAVDQFGISVAVSANMIVVGAHAEDHDTNGIAGDEVNPGAAYIFHKDQGGINNWGQVKKLISSDDAPWDFFGHAVSISGNTVIIGAYNESHDTNNNGSEETRVGAAYIFYKDQGGVDNWGQVRKLTAFDGTTNDSFSEGAVSVSDGVIVVGAWSDDNSFGGNAGAVYIYE